MEAKEMVGIRMYDEIQKRRSLEYKKQRAARELNLDTKTVHKYWEMTEEYIEQRLESKERGSAMEPYRECLLQRLREYSEITSAILNDNLLENFAGFAPSYLRVRRYVSLLREMVIVKHQRQRSKTVP